MESMREQAMAMQEQIRLDRRWLHQHPELGMDLPETKNYVKKRLAQMGIEAEDCGKSGITAVIGRKNQGKTILLRGDMDALPAAEKNDLPYRSEGPNGHLCGHDLHTAMLLGAAQLLKTREDQLQGQVKLMFQPGEETGEGAADMIAHGVLDNPKVDAAMAIHIFPFLSPGEMRYVQGTATSSMDAYFIEVQGKGGHSSQPHWAIDPLMIVCNIYMALSSLVAKEVNPFETAVLTVGRLEGGTAVNIIPDTAVLECGLRCYNSEVRDHLNRRIREIIEMTTKMYRGTCSIDFVETPCVINDQTLLEQLRGPVEEIVGKENFLQRPNPSNGSEDFSFIAQRVPAVFLMLGAKVEGNDFMLHNPNILLNEDTLPIGSAVYANCAVRWLEQNFEK